MDSMNNMEEDKTPRKRGANFTADEKALLAQLVKNRPIIESKVTDGKSVLKKKAAWVSLTQDFNCNPYVHKRETIILKRAWDNLKAMARKRRATERGNLLKTGGGPSISSHPPQQDAILSMVEEAAPVMVCEVNNSFDSDGTVLFSIKNKKNELLPVTEDEINKYCFDDILEIKDIEETEHETDLHFEKPTVCEDIIEFGAAASSNSRARAELEQTERRKPSDYIRREAVMRIKHLEAKKKIELQILKAKLENQAMKRQAAEMEVEKNKTLLEMAKLELTELKKKMNL